MNHPRPLLHQSGPAWRVLEGDCRDVLRTLDAGSVHTCVTSPPYFGLRDYGHGEQIGLETTPAEFVAALVDVFSEVRRVLRDDGTVWLNLGDSYAVNGGARINGSTDGAVGRGDAPGDPRRAPSGFKPKDLLGIPWMVAFALRADGWYLRSDIIWAKPNPMPESVADRPTKAHEYLFLLSKGLRYFYDAPAIAEESVKPYDPTPIEERPDWGKPNRGLNLEGNNFAGVNLGDGTTRNKRSVWTVPTVPYAGAHFATFPPALIEPCILAGCPERACEACGAPWERIVERTPMVVRPAPGTETMREQQGDYARTQTGGTMTQAPSTRTVGFEPSCACGGPAAAGVVLDPFNGAGTTGVVALRRDRSYVGIELNPEYADLARNRIRDDAPLLNTYAEAAA